MGKVTPLFVSGMVCAIAAVAATVGFAAPATAAPLYSKGFQVYNYVPDGLGYTVTLSSLTGNMNFEGAPTPPKKLAMGDFDDYELQIHPVTGDESDTASYDIEPNPSGQFYSTTVNVSMSIDNLGDNRHADCTVVSSDPHNAFSCGINVNHDPVIVTINSQAK